MEVNNKDLCLSFYRAVKRNSLCLICNTNENIQFHHIIPAEKLTEVYKVAAMGNMRLLRDEFNKTVPLCDADHKAVHKGRITGWLLGKTVHGGYSDHSQAIKHMPYLNRLEVTHERC